MKATLLRLWTENETRVARCPLVVGVTFIVLASLMGLLSDSGASLKAPLVGRQ
jgi:hypothetical protein